MRFEESRRLASGSGNPFEEAQALDGAGAALARLGRTPEAAALRARLAGVR